MWTRAIKKRKTLTNHDVQLHICLFQMVISHHFSSNWLVSCHSADCSLHSAQNAVPQVSAVLFISSFPIVLLCAALHLLFSYFKMRFRNFQGTTILEKGFFWHTYVWIGVFHNASPRSCDLNPGNMTALPVFLTILADFLFLIVYYFCPSSRMCPTFMLQGRLWLMCYV